MGDPTCVNGGIYYNSSSNQAKICINSSWAAIGVPRVTSLPGSPANGDEVYYVANASQGVLWHLRYNSSSTYWEKIGGPPLYAEVLTGQNTSSTSYVNLTTTGPSVTVPLAGDYEISHGAELISFSGNIYQHQSFSIGATAASDTDAISATTNAGTVSSMASRMVRKTGLSASTALVTKYRTSSGTATFADRWLRVDPIRVQ